jgi:hypothetical protein
VAKCSIFAALETFETNVCSFTNGRLSQEKLDDWMGAISLTPLWGLDRPIIQW